MSSKVRLGAIIVVVGVLVAGLLVWWTSRSTASCDVPRSVSEGPASAVDRAPSGGGLRVEDQGFTWTREPVDNAYHLVSVGAVLHNSTNMVAYHTTFVVKLLDRAGKPLQYKTLPRSSALEIPVIMPGQRIGVGEEVIPEVGGFIFDSHNRPLEPTIKQRYGDTGPVASIQIVLGPTHWLPRDAMGTDFVPDTADVTAFDVEYRSVHYVVHANGCGSLAQVGSVVVFRDESGVVVGGAAGDGNGSCGADGRSPTHAIYLVTGAPPPTRAVATRSAVYLYCDVGQPSTTSAPG